MDGSGRSRISCSGLSLWLLVHPTYGELDYTVLTSESDKRIVVLMRRTGGTGTVEGADTEVQGLERPVSIDEDGSDPVTFVFVLG